MQELKQDALFHLSDYVSVQELKQDDLFHLSDYAFVQELKQDDLFHFAPAFGGAHSSPRKLRFAACEFVGHLFAFRSVQSMLAVPHATVRSKAASM